MDELSFTFSTLTPIWTGDARRSCTRAQESGVIGSLRWWYEGIVRGMGGYACDPTAAGESACRLDVKKYQKGQAEGLRGGKLLAHAGLCPACQFFGATGWRRRFRVELAGLEPRSLFFTASQDVYQAAGNWLWRMFGAETTGGSRAGRGADAKFTFGVKALWGERAFIKIVPLGSDSGEIGARLVFMLNTISRYGAFGAKSQNGFGQVLFPEGFNEHLIEHGRRLVEDDVQQAFDSAENWPEGGAADSLFNLRRLFSTTYLLGPIEDYRKGLRQIGKPDDIFRWQYDPCAFDIRFKSRQHNPNTKTGRDFGMRPWFRERWGKGAADRLFGQSKARSDSERSAGRIHVSHLFKLPGNGEWRLKVWGCVPGDLCSDDGKPQDVGAVEREVSLFLKQKHMFPANRVESMYSPEEVLR